MPNSPATQKKRRSRKFTQPRSDAGNPTKPKRTSSKLLTIQELLSRHRCASIDDLSKVTGWQAHNIRAALTRLRQRKIPVVQDIVNGTSRYRIVVQ